MTTIDYTALADRANREGFSVCINRPCYVPKRGYFVGGVLPPEKVIVTEHVTPEMIELTYFRAYECRRDGLYHFLGVWHAGDQKYVEVSDWFQTEFLALHAARERGEQAVWDIVNETEIWVA